MPTLQGIFDWIAEQVEIIYLIGFIIGVVVFVWKRSVIGLVIFIAFTAFIGIFVLNPEVMLDLPGRIKDLVSL